MKLTLFPYTRLGRLLKKLGLATKTEIEILHTKTGVKVKCNKPQLLGRMLISYDDRDVYPAIPPPAIGMSNGSTIDLITAQEAYIKLLQDEIDSLVGIGALHGWKSTRVEEGNHLRAKIKRLKSL